MLSLRTLLRHPIQFAIMALGIALGVAVMVGIDIANASAARAFDLSTSAVTGRATHAIVGSAQGVDEPIYARLRTDPQWRNKLESAPVVIAYAVSPQLGEVPFTLLGIDPFAEAPFRSYLGAQQQTRQETIASLLTVPGAILLSTPTAQQYGLEPCAQRPSAINSSCSVTLSINGETRQSSSTAKMIFPVDECIAVLSQGFTVLPGDVIATGTPEGVGAALGKFLKAGDKMEAEVERIGVLANRVAKPS